MKVKALRYFVVFFVTVALMSVLFMFISPSVNTKINNYAKQFGVEQPMAQAPEVALAASASNITVSTFSSSYGMGNETWDTGGNKTVSVTRTVTLSGRMVAARSYFTCNFSSKVYDNNLSNATDEYFWFYANSAGFGSGDSSWNNVDGTRSNKNKIIYASNTNKSPTGNSIGIYMALRSGSKANPIDSGFNNVTFLMNKSETAAPSVSVPNEGYIASNTFTITDSQSGLYHYVVKNSSDTVKASYTNPTLTTRVSGAQTVTLPAGEYGRYSVYREDNLGNSATTYINYYSATTSIQAYTNGSINTTGGSVGNTASGGKSQHQFTGSTVGSSNTFYAAPKEGYYLSGWAKTTGNGTYTKTPGSKTKSYTIVSGDAFTTPIYFDAYFEAINTTNRTVTYNGSPQAVSNPTNIPSGLTYAIKYNGSTTIPTNAGEYSTVISILYGTETVGSKTVTLTIQQKQATITWTNTSRPYNGNAQLPTATVNNLVAGDTCSVTMSGAGTNVGNYTAKITALSNSNYSLPTTLTQAFTITKVTPTLSVTNNKAIFERERLSETALAILAKNPHNTSIAIPGTYSWANGIAEYPLASASKAYTITYYVEDTTNYNNATISVTLSVTRYNPTITLSTYLDGVISSTRNFATLSLDGVQNTYQVSANGKTINDSFSFSAVTNDGYYLDYWRKNSGVVVGNTYGSSTHTYTITTAEAYGGASTIYFDIYFRTIAGSFATSYTYNKAGQAPSSSAVANYTVTNYYSGTANDGTGWGTSGLGSTTKPTKAGSYTLITKHVYTSTGNTLGTKTLGFVINKKELTFAWSDTTPTYNGYNQIPVATATNLCDGDSCAIIVSGHQSQAASGYNATATSIDNTNYKLPANVTTSWSIVRKYLPVGYWQASISDAYTFTGARLFPTPTVTDDSLGLLVKDRDYTVSYAQNYSTTTGGTVYVYGIGNYQGDTLVAFDIDQRAHNTFFASLRHLNDHVGIEHIVAEFADFDIPFLPSLSYEGNFITLYAYTDAVYPDSFTQSNGNPNVSVMEPKRLVFQTSSNVIIDHLTDELVEIDGQYYSLTTARLYLYNDNNIVQYGVVPISIGATESINYSLAVDALPTRIIDDDYVADFGTEDATPLTHRIFIKKNHTAGGSFVADIIKTYGDVAFDITAGLNSGLTDFVVTCNNPNVLYVADGTSFTRRATIQNSGATKLSLYHPGVSNLNNPSDSYISISVTINLVVNKAMLTITPNNKTTVYGTAPSYANIAASYTFGGFCYDDNHTILGGVSSGYEPNSMKDAGTYYLTAKDAFFSSGCQNYYFMYPQNVATLTVTQKSLYAFIDDVAKLYGEPNPIPHITYTGFVYGENSTTAKNFVAPEINYDGATELSPIGQYTLHLEGGSSANYAINTIDTARLTISPASVQLALQAQSEDYNALSHYAATPTVIGVDGCMAPGGSVTISYLHGEEYTQAPPVNVGRYTVKLLYWATDQDNYKDTEAIFESAIIILPIAPEFILEHTTTDYTSYQYDGIPASAYLDVGVFGGTTPAGYPIFLYSHEGGEYSETLPKNSGRYTIRMIYILEDGIMDNYQNGSYRDFENGLIINKIHVGIELEKAISTYFSSDGDSPDKLFANQAQPHGVGTEYTLNPEQYPYEISYRYFVDGDWQLDAPYNAGNYKVEVSFAAQCDLNYKDTVVEFANAVEIQRAMPTILLNSRTMSYTGKRITQNAASIKGIVGGNHPSGNFEYLFATHGAANSAFSQDYPAINVNIQDGENVGYDIIVRFLADTNGNYASCEQRFDSAIIIEPISPRISLTPSSANFTGAPFNISSIMASVFGLAGGSAPSGSLTFEFIDANNKILDVPIEAGIYSVKATFVPTKTSVGGTHNNYTSVSGVFAKSVTIQKVAPILSLTSKKADYTGNPTTLSIDDGDYSIRGLTPEYPPKGNISVYYYIDDNWSLVGPIQSGSYRVKLTYTSGDNENYADYERIFNNGLTILNIAPVFADIEAESYIFNGKGVEPGFNIAIVGEAGKGSLSINYRIHGGTSWVSRAPIDVGTYDIRIVYTAAIKDNYKSHTQPYLKRLTIAPKEVTITPNANQTKVFDYTTIDNIAYTAEGLVPGDSLTGALAIKDTDINVGIYTILAGDLRIDTTGKPTTYADNYMLHFTEDVTYEILPAMVNLTFEPISENLLVYRPNDHKYKYVSVIASYNGNEIPVNVIVLGDDENVGDFMVSVTIDNANFELPTERTEIYTITPREMPKEDIIFESAVYSYTGNSRLFAVSRIFEGASVTYYYDGESSSTPYSFENTGEYEVTAVVSRANYTSVPVVATLTIVKALPIVNIKPFEGKLVFGDPLPTIECNNTDGTIALNEGQELIPGTYNYGWTFVPKNTDNCETIRGYIALTVEKAATSIQFEGELKQSVDNPQKFSAQIQSPKGTPQGLVSLSFYDSLGNEYSSLPSKAGKYTLVVRYEGDNYYSSSEYSTIITVTEQPNLAWIYIVIGIIVGIGIIGGIVAAAKRKA